MLGFYNYTTWLTYAGLVSAITGIAAGIRGELLFATVCLMFSGGCDFFDGRVAATKERTREERNFGIQLDSLADLVCFGVLPVVIAYQYGVQGVLGLTVLAFYALTALIRLAYFNVMEEIRQTETGEPRRHYDGLPVTTVSLILPVIYGLQKLVGAEAFVWVLGAAMLLIGLLFISRIRIAKPSLKQMFVILALGIVEFLLVVLL